MYRRYLYLVDEKYIEELAELVEQVETDFIDIADEKAAQKREQQIARIEEIIRTVNE